MEKLRYYERWISLIMHCIITVSPVLINGTTYGCITPTKDHRQGDPLCDELESVAQAVLTHIMSCFLLQKGLCDELEGMMRNFWWGQRQQEEKIPWVAWKKMCKSKLHRGMRFRNLQVFNLAMLAK